jgi:hypothetical protein
MSFFFFKKWLFFEGQSSRDNFPIKKIDPPKTTFTFKNEKQSPCIYWYSTVSTLLRKTRGFFMNYMRKIQIFGIYRWLGHF